MSENEKEEASSGQPTDQQPASAAQTETRTQTEEQSSDKLSDLMSSGERQAKERSKPDLDTDAMLAAQAAIEEGERALAAARAQLQQQKQPVRTRSKRREFALRMLLAANVLAMLIVVSLPSWQPPAGDGGLDTGTVALPNPTGSSATDPAPAVPAGPRLADKYNQALLASENREYARAVALLEEYLAEAPRMPASRLVNVYRAMAHYSSAIGRFREAQGYERRAQAVTQSHSLPEDLVAMARAAAESGDQESLRQVWARFLLQQRQIPSSLYQHVAEAYLQLGDSYRVQANDAAEQARLEALRQADELLREQRKNR